MKNEVHGNVLILTANFSCAIFVSEEEIIIKKPSKEQQYIEQIIIDAEQQAFQETLAAYKSTSTFSNFICNIPGFEDTFQQKLDSFIEQYGIIRVSEESLSMLPLVSPFTSELNIHTPIIYTSPSFSIINARGNCSNTSSMENAVKIGEIVGLPIYLYNSAMQMSSLRKFTAVNEANWSPKQSTAYFTGVAISDNGISFNITKAFNAWNRTSIKH
ncbi:hypothetical protein AMS59_01055 [Lysinibacillus sp. FJAT-14745]|uniref:hypothetical protein n=1 Tax=Lysinibacillus sp. FJAT-14745 TaxID=1704289 RepID=UPI0006AB8693|nr:hypothetical protein [Lysinibacillus sp. FJAT-14745]KOP81064.1 hypothetical protein AMS59_01055 [Lysinibacillus sp. FJAT-14745]